MSKQTKKALVPALRFPKFRDAGVWEEKRLEDICKKISQGGTPDTSILDYWNGDIEWLTPAEMGKLETRFITTTNRKISKAGLKNCSSDLLPINSVILSTRAPIGHLLINKSEMAINQGCKGLVPLPSIDHNYLYYSLARYKNALADLGAGNTFKELSGSALKNFELPISTIPEQQKIADCLSSLDELITSQTQKLAALKTHKKGLMQQLFPAEGETVPKLRFPEFLDAGEWEEKPLKKVFSIFQGFAFSSKDSVKNGARWLKIADVSIQQMDHDTPSYLPLEYKEKYEKFSVKLGDYVIALTRPILSKQLKIAPVDSVYDGALLNQRVGKLVTSQNTAFVYYFLQTAQLINEIEKNIAGSEPPNLSAQQIEDIKVYIPLEKEEQQKIADCFSSIDELIAAQTQKLAALKAHKKGLMQQLFPSANVVNG
jgi:type I restriction enzyme S subunit